MRWLALILVLDVGYFYERMLTSDLLWKIRAKVGLNIFKKQSKSRDFAAQKGIGLGLGLFCYVYINKSGKKSNVQRGGGGKKNWILTQFIEV